MNNNQDGVSNNAWLQTATFLVVAVTAGGLYFQEAPFELERPEGELGVYELPASRSRNWEDPLKVAEREFQESYEREIQYYSENNNSQRHKAYRQALINLAKKRAPEKLMAKICEGIEVGCDQQIRSVIGAMLPGGHHSDDVESRLEIRYAIAAAMYSEGYVPVENSWTIYDFDYRSVKNRSIDDACPYHDDCSAVKGGDDVDSLDSSRYMPIFVSYFQRFDIDVDWSGQGDSQANGVLVLWLDENVIENKGYKNDINDIASIFDEILDSKINDRLLAIIGPSDSRRMGRLLKYSSEEGTDQAKKIKESLVMINGRSTREKKGDVYLNSRRADVLGIGGYYQTIAGDYETVGALVNELESRAIPCTELALFVEIDSSYSLAMEDSIRELYGCGAPLMRYGYMRGVDGRLVGDKLVDHDDAGRAVIVESPNGAHQLDYLRRVVKSFVDNGQSRKIKAIGIFGVDVYDKLLVIQAIRSVTQDILIFTTDINANLIADASHDWLRGVLISSSYDLGANRAYSGQVTDVESIYYYRSNYQMSYEQAVRLVLGGQNDARLNQKLAPCDDFIDLPNETSFCMSNVRVGSEWQSAVHEIGRNGFVRQTSGISKKKAVEGSGFVDGARLLIRYLLVLLWPLMVLAVYVKFNPIIKSEVGDSQSYNWLLVGTAFSLFFCLVMGWWLMVGSQEPSVLDQGVSVIPAFVLRIQVIVFAIVGLWLVALHLLNHESKMIDESYLVEDGQSDGGESRIRELDKLDLQGFVGRLGLEKTLKPHLRDWLKRSLLLGLSVSFLIYVFDIDFFVKSYADKSLHLAIEWGTGLSFFMIIAVVATCSRIFQADINMVLYAHRDRVAAIFSQCMKMDKESESCIDLNDLKKNISRCRGIFRLVMRSTELSLRTSLLPIIMIVIFAFSYSRWFEAWSWPDDVLVLLFVLSAIVIGSALVLQIRVRQFRDSTLAKMNQCINKVPDDQIASAQILISEFEEWVRHQRRGAFTPLWQHPLVQVVALQILAGIALAFQPSVQI
ncbi:MAG: hypothetical protein Tsb002_11810 [Wenzhouxiangellaceae bacterium]